MSNMKLPKDYFKNLQNNIVKNINDLKDDLESNAPLLSRIGRKNIYSIPDNYFSNSESNLLKPHTTKIRLLSKNFLSIAASLLLMISITWVAFNNPNTEESLIAEVEDEYIFDYFLENADELDNAILAELDNDEIIEGELDFEEISNDELTDYIETIVDDISIEDLEIINI